MQIAIVGLPLTGKSTLFSALTGKEVQTGYAAAGMDTHLAIVDVPDSRLDALHSLVPQAKKRHTTIEYVDFAGIAQGTGKAGFEAKLINDLRPTDALLVVVRAFENPAVPAANGGVNPEREFQSIEEEFILSDLAIVENRLEKLRKQRQKFGKDGPTELEMQLLTACQKTLDEGSPLRNLSLADNERKVLRGFQFLTLKPMVVAVNISEDDLPRAAAIEAAFRQSFKRKDTEFIVLSAVIEMEIARLPEQDARAFLEDLGINKPALAQMIRASYHLLDLLTFFTFGENEVRSWTIKSGMTAKQAAGEIHSDLERGFIRAETVYWEELFSHKSLARCREVGALRLEGKDYLVKDGDVITFRFNV